MSKIAGESDFLHRFNAFHEWAKNNFGDNLNQATLKDDWTAVVMLHAIIETALNAVLVSELGRPELERIIAKLDTSNTAIGKVAFAKKLGILPHKACVFIQKFSEIRNFCVHDIRHFDFNFATYLRELERDESNAVFKAVCAYLDIRRDLAEKLEPKMLFWLGTMFILMRVHGGIGELHAVQNQSTPNQ